MAEKFLLIQLGDIGDIVWMMPAIRAIKDSGRAATISILVKKAFGSLLQGQPIIDEIFLVPDSSGSRALKDNLSLMSELRKRKFDMVIDFRSGDRGAAMSFVCGAPVRVAELYRSGVPFWRNWAYTRLVEPVHIRIRGAAEQSLRILREIGIDSKSEVPEIQVPNRKRGAVRVRLKEKGFDDGDVWVSINPFSRWSYKEIDPEKWVEVVNWLWSEYRIKSILIGSPGEREKAEKIKSETSQHCINLAGETSLGDLPSLLSLSRLHIGVDSAGPHIAAAVGTPTVTIYGPSDWFDWAPVGDRHSLIIPDMECSPCHRKGCEDSGKSKCLDELPVEKIKTAIVSAIEKTSA
jgi:ADP-heptose:LPS heptosyltransferase